MHFGERERERVCVCVCVCVSVSVCDLEVSLITCPQGPSPYLDQVTQSGTVCRTPNSWGKTMTGRGDNSRDTRQGSLFICLRGLKGPGAKKHLGPFQYIRNNNNTE